MREQCKTLNLVKDDNCKISPKIMKGFLNKNGNALPLEQNSCPREMTESKSDDSMEVQNFQAGRKRRKVFLNYRQPKNASKLGNGTKGTQDLNERVLQKWEMKNLGKSRNPKRKVIKSSESSREALHRKQDKSNRNHLLQGEPAISNDNQPGPSKFPFKTRRTSQNSITPTYFYGFDDASDEEVIDESILNVYFKNLPHIPHITEKPSNMQSLGPMSRSLGCSSEDNIHSGIVIRKRGRPRKSLKTKEVEANKTLNSLAKPGPSGVAHVATRQNIPKDSSSEQMQSSSTIFGKGIATRFQKFNCKPQISPSAGAKENTSNGLLSSRSVPDMIIGNDARDSTEPIAGSSKSNIVVNNPQPCSSRFEDSARKDSESSRKKPFTSLFQQHVQSSSDDDSEGTPSDYDEEIPNNSNEHACDNPGEPVDSMESEDELPLNPRLPRDDIDIVNHAEEISDMEVERRRFNFNERNINFTRPNTQEMAINNSTVQFNCMTMNQMHEIRNHQPPWFNMLMRNHQNIANFEVNEVRKMLNMVLNNERMKIQMLNRILGDVVNNPNQNPLQD